MLNGFEKEYERLVIFYATKQIELNMDEFTQATDEEKMNLFRRAEKRVSEVEEIVGETCEEFFEEVEFVRSILGE